LYSSDLGSDYDPICGEVGDANDDQECSAKPENPNASSTAVDMDVMDLDDAPGDACPSHNHGDDDRTPNCNTPIGKMHSRKLAKELKLRERAILKRHEEESKMERRAYHSKSLSLKAKHQGIIDAIIEESLVERQSLREFINERVETLQKRQEESTEQLKRRDEQLMREALFAEDQRVQEASSSSFIKAQELISAQVFHEGMQV
jgi:hypothetical protein